MLLKRLFILFFAVFAALVSSSQNDSTTGKVWSIKPSINAGYILVHRISIGHLVRGYPGIYELNLVRHSQGDKMWQRENNLPDYGLTLQCLDFKNPSQLGYALTAAPFVEIPLNKTVKPSRLILRLCMGATYITKEFDINTNHKNIAIGSHWNAYVQFKWFWHLQINNRLRLEPGFAFTHASNGRSGNPNLGLNVVSANLGLNYVFRQAPKKVILKIDSSTKVKSRNEVLLYTSYGINQRGINGPYLNCFSWSAAFQRNIRNTHKFSAGLDAFYDGNYIIDYQNAYGKSPTGLDQLRLGVRLGYSYNVGAVSFPFEMGYYVYQKTYPDAAVFSRIGVRYYSKSGLVAHLGLRTHFAVAYNFEYGLGYRFFL